MLQPTFDSKSLSGSTLTTTPSSSFSSAGSSTLLFGEIDSCSDSSASSATYHSACSLVFSSNPTFVRFWTSDACRTTLQSLLRKRDLVNLRLVCHDFSTRLAPPVFEKLDITFRASTFSKPAKTLALDRIGHLVQSLAITIPHTQETLLPPVIDPWTGEEQDFVYRPQFQTFPSSSTTTTTSPPLVARQARYGGDAELTDLVIKQYPPLFHAATNIPSFVRAVLALPGLSHLTIRCPETGGATYKARRRSIVDCALISLRIAVERGGAESLRSLELDDVHLDGLFYLSPLMGFGATPASAKTWSRIERLVMRIRDCASVSDPTKMQRGGGGGGRIKMLHAYLRNFRNLEHLDFCWLGARGPSPLPCLAASVSQSPVPRHPGSRGNRQEKKQGYGPSSPPPPMFPNIKSLGIENATLAAAQISNLLASHRQSLQDLTLENILLLNGGNWEDALAPLRHPARCGRDPKATEVHWDDQRGGGNVDQGRRVEAEVEVEVEAEAEVGDVPIMLGSSLLAGLTRDTASLRRRHAVTEAAEHKKGGAGKFGGDVRVKYSDAPASAHVPDAPSSSSSSSSSPSPPGLHGGNPTIIKRSGTTAANRPRLRGQEGMADGSATTDAVRGILLAEQAALTQSHKRHHGNNKHVHPGKKRKAAGVPTKKKKTTMMMDGGGDGDDDGAGVGEKGNGAVDSGGGFWGGCKGVKRALALKGGFLNWRL